MRVLWFGLTAPLLTEGGYDLHKTSSLALLLSGTA